MLRALRSVMPSVVAMSRRRNAGSPGDAGQGLGMAGEAASLRQSNAYIKFPETYY